VEAQAGLSLFQQGVDDLLIEQGRVAGCRTAMALEFHAPTVVLTTGTFLNGRMHLGERQSSGGRAGDAPAIALAERLRELDLPVGRLKTGTPPRVDGKSVDFSALEEQPGDHPPPVFSFTGTAAEHPRQVSCWITHTNERTHELIRRALHRSPMYSGAIEGAGPRYCPSIEDKVVRFADRSRHQVFIEPEGLHTHELYPNGISTSLPFDVQVELVRSMPGFANAHLTRPGYAVEYDFFDPRGLRPSLETQAIGGLFFAGQINGTTGYEEAAAQGLVAGLNAARQARGLEPWTPRRDEAYMGVLIDDLVTQGTREPYRMFTSRAEYRLQLREDNADLRLTARGRELDLVGDGRWQAFEARREAIEGERQRLARTWLNAGNPLGRALEDAHGIRLSRETSALDLLKRPGLDYAALMEVEGIGPGVDDSGVAEQVEVQVRYAGYLERQSAEIERRRRNEATTIPDALDYDRVRGLSGEAREKLQAVRPASIGQASRIPGMTPAAISLLLVHLKRLDIAKKIA